MKINEVIHSVWFQKDTLDCYTIIIQPSYFPAEEGYYNCIAMSADTVKFCEFQRCTLGEHLGTPIEFKDLPAIGQEKCLDMLHSKEDIEWMTHQIDYSIEEKQEAFVFDKDGNGTLNDGNMFPVSEETEDLHKSVL